MSPIPLKPEYAKAQQDEAERRALIQRISEGKPTYSARDNNDGRLTSYQTADLYDENLETLRKIDAIVAEQRRIASMSVEEIHAQRRRDEIARGLAQNVGLPSHWVPTFDGQNRNTGVQIKAGVQVELSADVIKHLHRDDLVKLIRSYGADAVNAALGVKPRPEFGRTQIIQR